MYSLRLQSWFLDKSAVSIFSQDKLTSTYTSVGNRLIQPISSSSSVKQKTAALYLSSQC